MCIRDRYDVVLRPDLRQSLIENNLFIIERLGYERQNVEPRLFYTRADAAKTEALFREHGIANDNPRIVCITQTSRTQRRGWPIRPLSSVLNHARSRYNAEIIFVGTESEAQEIEAIRAEVSETARSFAGQTTIPMMAAVLASSDLVLTLDTGNMHVARTADVPMLILAPAWANSVEWLPMGFDRFHIMFGKLDPCSPPGCEIIQMDAERVIEAMDRLLTKFPPSSVARHRRIERNLSETRL